MTLKPIVIADLKGGLIINAGYTDGDEFKNIPVLTIRLQGGTRVTLCVLQDAEGNGEGWVDIAGYQLADSAIRADMRF